jgi:hypothetical protein
MMVTGFLCGNFGYVVLQSDYKLLLIGADAALCTVLQLSKS